MPRPTRIKVKVNGDYQEVVSGRSPAVLRQEESDRKPPKIDVSRLPDPKELERRG